MTTPEPEFLKAASSEQMTVTSDHRMVYTPAAENSSKFIGWAIAVAVIAVVFLTLFLVSKSNRSSSTSSPMSAATTPEPELVEPLKPVVVISDPSQEWMIAYQSVLAAASQPDTALLEPAMSGLVRLQLGRSPLAAEQRASVRALNLKGLSAVKDSSFEDAADAFFSAHQIDATDAEVAENLGYALYKDAKFEPAIRALLNSLASAPRRATAWGILGGAYAHVGEQVHATAAFGVSLRYAKSPKNTRSNFVSLYQEDPEATVRTAVGSALATQFASLVDPGIREQLGALSKFPFSALLPTRIQLSDVAGTKVKAHALNNSVFPIEVDADGYALWLGSDKDCLVQTCIVGRVSGRKSLTELGNQGVEVSLDGGNRGVFHKGSEKELSWLTIERSGIVHRFSMASEIDLVKVANSALSVGPIPVAIFAGRSVYRTDPETIFQPVAPAGNTPDDASSLARTLATSPKGAQLTSEKIYARASNSVVLVIATNTLGSGVVVAPEIVVTNCHVTKNGGVVVRYRKIEYAAVVVAGDEDFDYCILKVAGLPAAVAPMGPLSEVAPGQRVYSLGSPRGLELTFAEGVISALRPSAKLPLPIIQTTAPISPGSSGGGLFDEYGRVIGITTFFREESQNLNFAMPVELYQKVLQTSAIKPSRPTPIEAQAVIPPPYFGACGIGFTIDLQTFGDRVEVELRNGRPGSSRSIDSRQSQGGRVYFSNLCPGNYFLAIGDNDYVSVTPVRSFVEGGSYSSRITTQRGSGNLSRQSRKTL